MDMLLHDNTILPIIFGPICDTEYSNIPSTVDCPETQLKGILISLA